jgi:hypothetical protein
MRYQRTIGTPEIPEPPRVDDEVARYGGRPPFGCPVFDDPRFAGIHGARTLRCRSSGYGRAAKAGNHPYDRSDAIHVLHLASPSVRFTAQLSTAFIENRNSVAAAEAPRHATAAMTRAIRAEQ